MTSNEKPVLPDLHALQLPDLLKVWQENRNSLLGVMAANEVMGRLWKQQETKQCLGS